MHWLSCFQIPQIPHSHENKSTFTSITRTNDSTSSLSSATYFLEQATLSLNPVSRLFYIAWTYPFYNTFECFQPCWFPVFKCSFLTWQTLTHTPLMTIWPSAATRYPKEPEIWSLMEFAGESLYILLRNKNENGVLTSTLWSKVSFSATQTKRPKSQSSHFLNLSQMC